MIIVVIPLLTNCQEEWVKGRGTSKEYLLYDEDTKIKFDDARKLCESTQSRLPEIMNGWENLAVKEMIPPASGTIKLIWLGAKKVANTKFEWLSGKQLSSYANWNAKYPDFQYTGVDLRVDNGKWENDALNADKYVVCERDLASEPEIKQDVNERLNEMTRQISLNQQATDRKFRMIEERLNKRFL